MSKDTLHPNTKETMEKTLLECIQVLSAPVNGVSTFNEMMDVQLCSCNPEERSAVFRFSPKGWMVNSNGTLHGGIFASIFDYCMGILCGCYANNVMTPAVGIDVRYLIPGPVNQPLYIRAVLTHRGRVISAATADMHAEGQDDRILATASGSYYTAV